MSSPEHKGNDYPILPKNTAERVRGGVYTHPTKGHLVKCYGEKKQPRKIKAPKKAPEKALPPVDDWAPTDYWVDYPAIAFEFVRQNGNHNMLGYGARREIDYLLNKFQRPSMTTSEMSNITLGDGYNARCGKLRGYSKEQLLLLLSFGTDIEYNVENIIPKDISASQQSFGFAF